MSQVQQLTSSSTRRQQDAPSFVDRHILVVAFTVATLFHFLFSFFSLTIGAALGFSFHSYTDTSLKLGPKDKIITSTSSIFAVIGAFAVFIQIMPVGVLGGGIFHAIPYASAFTAGATLYRAYAYCKSTVFSAKTILPFS
ncbi:MAG: hypothetical protein ACD_17C00065G0003 [uncultured bacterium]|nr:MAG: hypothetical protein ACD_17C00065G0003 [uncultured bacterium]OGN55342.1 MAG: hypothetical protein A2796_02270 [Chlamydiae bacterium RIFCSPHIGHO2_01_FULL_44_39]OGN59845.1 MAG: hypothetical protein A3D96_03585 [Chlamydiae bacterium RIFCSPHIGHO2_12_FULL_44_59]OGN66052.1 MAG: hypothetical protein A2978_04100 [Chlamydiae bacterium RIFCSPLOWO2_01_FULL_44_52]OGN68588.1 MAG: hypothetical protein A3I67_02425 [Chlamydiae bacterium RIFCSPLOWO2_02_FULL_45_22]OGN69700.1 MAG: hypothetical protein A3